MGCSPTAQRLSSIPSCNVHAYSKSTRSTGKNSDQILSHEKPNFFDRNGHLKCQVNRYYSPKSFPNAKKKSVPKNSSTQKQNNIRKYLPKENLTTKTEIKPTKSVDTVSHLSLNSQFNSKQNMQFLENKTQNLWAREKRFGNQNAENFTKLKSRHDVDKKIEKNDIDRYNILQRELRGMNAQRFQRIKIERMNF